MMPSTRFAKPAFALCFAALTLCPAALSQQSPDQSGQGSGQGPGRRGGFAGMQSAQGEVTAVSGATLTIKTEDGTAYQVVTTDNTRMMEAPRGMRMGGGPGQNRGEGGQTPTPIKIADIKVGDGVMAFGQMDAEHKTLHAAMLAHTDAATVKAMRENLGKTYISGKVTAIDLDKPSLTVERPDHVSQTIGFDETTSFRRPARGMRGGAVVSGGSAPAAPGGESITLADIKVGDNVAGQGAVKNGVFVPAQLTVIPPRPPRPAAEAAPAPAR